MQKTFVLLVGINNYPSPIRSLDGCLKDLDSVEEYLKTSISIDTVRPMSIDGLPVQQYNHLQICRLQNDQATHSNICKGFEKFLVQATEKDVVWFHFSGHGAESPTAKEFLPIEPNGKDQTLVCYQKTDKDHLHLADKELAVLLDKAANFDLKGRAKKSPHIVVTLDCCHSGSGTRDVLMTSELKSRNLMDNLDTRMSIANQPARLLSTYANGFYSQQLAQKSQLEIPLSKHLLISACESVQVAGDLPAGGVFTSGLIKALTNVTEPLNYADLFIKTRSAVQKIRTDQLPQFEPLGNFNPYTRFLDGAALGNPNRFEIFQKNEKWMVKCGTIHGLSLHSRHLEIQTLTHNAPKVGVGKLISVGGLTSTFDWIEGKAMDSAANYRAVISTFINEPVLVGLTGEPTELVNIKNVWEDSTSIQWTEGLATETDWLLEVEAKDGAYVIHNRRRKTIALTWSQAKDKAAEFIMDCLKKIVKWERMLTLNKANSRIVDWVDFELGIMDKHKKKLFHKDAKITIEAGTHNCFEKEGALVLGFFPRVKIKHTNRNIYCYLFHLRTNYSIQAEEGGIVYRTEEHEKPPTLPLVKKGKAWGLAAEDTSVTCWFKLIITTEPLDHQQFLQSNLLGERAVISRNEMVSAMDEWHGRDIQVVMKRKK